MSGQPHTNLFNRVDRSSDPDFFVRFMDEADTPAGVRARKRLVRERMALTPGQAVLDVGWGPGNDLFELVELVGPTGPRARRRCQPHHDRGSAASRRTAALRTALFDYIDAFYNTQCIQTATRPLNPPRIREPRRRITARVHARIGVHIEISTASLTAPPARKLFSRSRSAMKTSWMKYEGGSAKANGRLGNDTCRPCSRIVMSTSVQSQSSSPSALVPHTGIRVRKCPCRYL